MIRARRGLIKVPEVTAIFWVTKLLTTAMGESTSDYLVKHMDPVVAVGLGGIALVASLALQLVARKYIPWIYWLAVLMVAIAGTMAADVLHIRFGVPYAASTVLFAVVLTAVFVLWYRAEGTLSIHSIDNRRREIFYWTTVVATFAMGTALGDLTAITFHLGYLSSAVLFAAVMLVPAVGFWRFGWNEVFSFWFAYVLTRPLGASIADWLGKPHELGGMGFGDGVVTLVFALAILGCVRLMTLEWRRRADYGFVPD
jgi:uncharacterized membrane-anchored protein